MGAAECDSQDGEPTCDSPAADVEPLLDTVHGFHDARFAVGPGMMLYAAKGRQIVPIDFSDPARPRRQRPVHLTAAVREVLVRTATLFVATTAGLEAYSLATPSSPAHLWRWPMAGGVDDLALAGTTLVAVQRDGFRVLDVSNPLAPDELASHRLVRVLPGWWELDSSGCERDLVRWLFPGSRRVGQFDGRTLVVGDLLDMIALEVAADGLVERVYDSTVLPGRVREMKLHQRMIYTDTFGGFGFVVRVGDGDLDWEGIHALDGWADNAVFTPAAAFRTTRRGIEVAYAP